MRGAISPAASLKHRRLIPARREYQPPSAEHFRLDRPDPQFGQLKNPRGFERIEETPNLTGALERRRWPAGRIKVVQGSTATPPRALRPPRLIDTRSHSDSCYFRFNGRFQRSTGRRARVSSPSREQRSKFPAPREGAQAAVAPVAWLRARMKASLAHG